MEIMKKMPPTLSSAGDAPQRPVCHGWVAKISLVIFFLAYVSLGAYVFMLIESSALQQSDALHTPPTEEIRTALDAGANQAGPDTSPEVVQIQEHMTRQVLDRLWDITENLNILYKENWTRLAADEMARFRESIHLWVKKDCIKQAQQQLLTGGQPTVPAVKQIPATAKWTYPTAFLYSLSVITTLGAHPVTPETVEGKVLTILYASFGIPLLLLYLTVVGSALSSCLCCFPHLITKRRRTPRRQVSGSVNKSPALVTARYDSTCHANELFHHPLKAAIKDDESIEASSSSSTSSTSLSWQSRWPPVFCLVLILVYITWGTWIFSWLMSLALIDALLLSFMLLTTMGIPDAQSAVWSGSGLQIVMALYVIVGLTMCSVCFNLLYEWLLTRWTDPHRPAVSSRS